MSKHTSLIKSQEQGNLWAQSNGYNSGKGGALAYLGGSLIDIIDGFRVHLDEGGLSDDETAVHSLGLS